MSDRNSEEAADRAEEDSRQKFEARFPPDAFKPVAVALGKTETPECLKAIDRWLARIIHEGLAAPQ